MTYGDECAGRAVKIVVNSKKGIVGGFVSVIGEAPGRAARHD